MSARRRVAITGIGLVTPVGNDVATTWASLDGAKNGAAPITLFDASGFTTRIAAEVKGFDDRVITAPRKHLTTRTARTASRSRLRKKRCATRASRPTTKTAIGGAARSAPA
jgi:3-oxoacyl-(acyl-carrier-protein) synthase